jgi:mannose-1-phosphate guanylyltransferase
VTSTSSFHAIVPAGGAGTRLWPLSRTTRPKFLLDLDGSGRTMIQQTVDRLSPLASSIHVVTGQAHAEQVAAQVPEVDSVFREPSPRDSMPAIGLAAAVIHQRDPNATIGSFAADQVIPEYEPFAEAVTEAIEVAQGGQVVTIGISPTGPSSAFGYIDGADRLEQFPTARRVAHFVEKPDEATAASYLAAGTFSWNAGMFISRAGVLLDALAAFQPELHEGLTRIAASWDTPERDEVLEKLWPSLTKIAIDHAIAEPLSVQGGVAVVAGRFRWSDVGDFAALADLVGKGGDDAVRVEADRSFVVNNSEKLVSIVGIDDAVVVVTDDAILVTTRAAAQKVRKAPSAWADRGRFDVV